MTTNIEWKISKSPVIYPEALEFMEKRVDGIIKGDAPETVWLLEHPPLLTAGTSAKSSDLLESAGFPVYETGRGGQYTYHGPGQRVAYVMLNLKNRGQEPDLRLYIKQLEDWIIRSLAHFGISGEVRDGRVGVWVASNSGMEKKIAAIGVRIKRWVTYHGIAINVNPDLSHYAGIVPCGIREFGVTSLRDLGINTTMEELDTALKEEFGEIFVI